MDVNSLWKERANGYWTIAVRYLRYIGNSGFLFSVYALFILATYYYSVLIRNLPEHFPAVGVMSVILLFFVMRGGIRTFLKEADGIFILSTEQRMRGYFQKSILYSFIMQTFVIVLVSFALAPLYFAKVSDNRSVYIVSLLLILLLKGWNLLSKWEELRLPENRFKQLSPFVRGAISLLFLYVVLDQRWLFTAGLILIIGILYLSVYRRIAVDHPLKWGRLIELESGSLMLFYRIANMFIEVPSISRKVKERRWADGIIRLLSANRKSVHIYLYTRAFVRSNDYLGIYFRLTLIGGLLVYFLPEGFLLWAFAALFVYMTTLQLTTLYPHFDAKVWIDLYPISKSVRFQAIQQLLFRSMVIQVVIFTIITFFNGFSIFQALIVLILGLLVVFTFVNLRLRNQLAKKYVLEDV